MAETPSSYKAQFLEVALSSGALTFGSFTLKSGRVSPYFFNAGNFYRADLLRALSTAYAKTLDESRLDFDIIFGPAYKGIPLCAATVDKLADLDLAKYGHKCYSFDRKEAKDHGEGGNIVGAPLRGKKVLIIDDVVTAGTAKREAVEKIRKEGGIVVGILIALDRMEKLPSPDGNDAQPMPSAIGQIRKEYGVPVLTILTLDDIIRGLRETPFAHELPNIEAYRSQYRATED